MTAYLCFAGTNQSGIPQWRTGEKFPSAHPTGAGCPERRGFCKSATIMGCLKYGACFSGLDAQDDPFFSCIAGQVRDMVGQQLELA